MNYCDFIVCMEEKVRKAFENEDVEIEVRKIVKTNDFMKDGLSIREKDKLAAPTIYLDDLFEWYEEGMTTDDIVQRVKELFENSREAVPEEFFSMQNFEKARDNITCRIINKGANEKYLEGVPHKDIHDLAIIFYCTCIYGEEQHLYCSKINNELMEIWGVDTDTLFELAVRNTPRLLGVYIEDIGQVLKEMISGKIPGDEAEAMGTLCDEKKLPMYILTNNFRNSGSVYMFIGNYLKEVSDKLESDLYVIPSSIHEVLLVPVSTGMELKDINEMVVNVNRETLRIQDVLSDHAYIYLRKYDRIIM